MFKKEKTKENTAVNAVNNEGLPVVEFSLFGMIVSIFSKWKWLIIGLVAGAVLFTAYSCLTGTSGLPGSELARQHAAGPVDPVSYLSEEDRERVANIDELIEQCQNDINECYRYAEDSIVLNMDPDEAHKVYTVVSFVPDESCRSEEPTEDEIMDAIALYADEARCNEVIEPLANELGIERRHMRALVYPYNDPEEDYLQLVISCYYTDEEFARHTCEVIVDDLRAFRDEIEGAEGGSQTPGLHAMITAPVVGDAGNDGYISRHISNGEWTIQQYQDTMNGYIIDRDTILRAAGTENLLSAPYRSIKADVVVGAVMGLVVVLAVICIKYIYDEAWAARKKKG